MKKHLKLLTEKKFHTVTLDDFTEAQNSMRIKARFNYLVSGTYIIRFVSQNGTDLVCNYKQTHLVKSLFCKKLFQLVLKMNLGII